MGIVYTAKAAIEIKPVCSQYTNDAGVYVDGSGVACLVTIADFTYSCNYLAGVRLTLVKGPNHGRRASEVAADRARSAYEHHVLAHTTEEWRSLNSAMYSDE